MQPLMTDPMENTTCRKVSISYTSYVQRFTESKRPGTVILPNIWCVFFISFDRPRTPSDDTRQGHVSRRRVVPRGCEVQTRTALPTQRRAG